MKEEERPKTCDLCKMPIEKIVKPIDCTDEETNECAICLTNPIDTLLVPCGHTICFDCAKKWFDDNFDCPFCRDKSCRYRIYVTYS